MIDKVLGNRYEIMEQIGGGGMALVYKARCRLLDRFVAIKILRDEFIDDEEFIRKFRRESQAAASLSHPNIVNIYDVGVEKLEDKEIQYIVMEYIKGITLKDYIREKGKFSSDETIYFALQIAEALQHAHKNHIVHRDIKPQNIMITEDKRVKVTDFGIARAATSSTVTTTSNVLGSVHYFSPEQARGGYTDEKSDIYSLGIVMYEMITGKLPFDGDSPITVALKHVQEDIVPPREIDDDIPNSIQAIIMKSVQKRQSDRYNNIGDLILDLKSIKLHGNMGTRKNENFDESPTRMVPIITDEGVDNMKTNKKKAKSLKKKENKSDGGAKMYLLGILLAFLLVSVMFFGYFKLKGFLESDETIVPDVLGKLEEEAREIILAEGLGFEVIGTTTNTEFGPGEVVTQTPEGESKVNSGFTVKVTINQGSSLVEIPSVVNKSLNDAEIILNDKSLKVSLSYDYSDTIPVDVVIEQDPVAGESVEPGSKVRLIISQGEKVESEIMPQLVGLNINDAERVIEALDFVVGEVKREHNEDVEKDIVYWQEYEPKNELKTKTSIDLYVSLGPAEEVEDENGEGDQDGVEEPDGTEDNNEKSISLEVTPFLDRDETTIKVIRNQDGVSDLVYNKAHKATEGEIIIPLSGKVGSSFEVLYDDIFQFSRRIEE